MDTLEAPIGRREKRKQEIRARIEDAASALFKDRGIEDTSIEQICVVADVARRTFYGYYPNKGALLRSLSQSRVSDTADYLVNNILRRHASTHDRLSAMIDYMETNLGDYDEIDRRLILVIPASPDDDNHLRDVSFTMEHCYAECFREGQLNGDANSDFSPEILAEMVSGTLNNIIMNWALDTGYPVKKKLQEARRLFTNTICR